MMFCTLVGVGHIEGVNLGLPQLRGLDLTTLAAGSRSTIGGRVTS